MQRAQRQPVGAQEAMLRARQAPPALRRLATPMLVRWTAARMLAENPGTPPGELAARVRRDRLAAEAGQCPDPGAIALMARLEQRLASAAEASRLGAGSRLPSAVVLVLANLVPLYGVLLLDWPVLPLIVLYWLENVIVGALNALRMLTLDPLDPLLWAGKLFLVPFFCVHYGMFTVGHGVFVFALFGAEASQGGGLVDLDAWLAQVGAMGLWWPAAALLASHAFSVGWNWFWRGEFRLGSLKTLMTQPYRRIIVLHLTIIFGGGAAMALGSPAWALVLLLTLKMAMDLRGHLTEHRVHSDGVAQRKAR